MNRTHMRMLTCRTMLFACALFAAGCSEKAAPPAPPQAKLAGNGTIEFAAGSTQLGALMTAKAAPLSDTAHRLNGRIVWDEDRTVRVFAPLAGRVQSILVRQGDAVRAGQTLAVVSAPELGQAQAEARRAEQDLALAQKALARVKELHDAGVTPAKDLQSAQADAARAEAELARTAARMKLYGGAASAGGAVDQQFALRAPIGGVVVERNINPGQELRPDQGGDKSLFTISDPAHLWFVLDAVEADVPMLRPGAEVKLTSPLLGEDVIPGRIAHVADFVDPQTRTVRARGTVENKDRRLKAEMFVTGLLRVDSTPGVVVPAEAVFLRGDTYFVFVQTAPNRFTRRAVKAGPAHGDTQAVLEGLAPGETVVTDGALLLQRMLATTR
jgi:membrane fusion protein, heavy metal efflux system